MAQLVKLEESSVINQLDTYNYVVPTAGMYKMKVRLNEVPPSGMSIVMKQNSSTVASLSSPATSQQAMDLEIVVNAAMNDVLGLVLSSSQASDQGGNSFKAIYLLSQGAN